MTERPLRLGYTILLTADLDPLRRFYVEVLGLTVLEERDGYVKLDAGAVHLALRRSDRPYDDDGGSGRAVQLAFPVSGDEVDVWHDRLRARGVAIVDPPTDQRWGHRTLFVIDPDGNLVELYADIDEPGVG